DQSRAISCRGRATWPRRDLFQGQGLGCPHGQGRSPDHWSEPGLVRSGRQGPDRHSEGEIANSRAAAKKHCYSIPSSARATSLSGTVRPSAFAVLRLATVSNLVGACTGRSAGFLPPKDAKRACLGSVFWREIHAVEFGEPHRTPVPEPHGRVAHLPLDRAPL